MFKPGDTVYLLRGGRIGVIDSLHEIVGAYYVRMRHLGTLESYYGYHLGLISDKDTKIYQGKTIALVVIKCESSPNT